MRRHLIYIPFPALLAALLATAGGAARADGRLTVSVPVDGSSIAAVVRERSAPPPGAPSAAAAEVPPPAGPPTVASSVGPADHAGADLADARKIAERAGAAAAIEAAVNGPEREEGEDAVGARSGGGNGEATPADGTVEEAVSPPASPPETVAAETGEMPRAAQAPSPAELGIAIDPLAGPTGQSPEVPLAEAVAQAEERLAKPLHLLHGQVPPGTAQRLSWSATELFEGVPIATPVLVVNGRLPGPTLCLTAAVHGDELNGIEMVRRVMHNLEAKELSGAVIGVPIVNLQGFRSASRYLPDRRDLNRYFPGNPQGSQASRIAFSFFTEIVTHCDALIDLHTGSFERANLPQLRADLRNPDVVTLTQGFGATVILHSDPAEGTLRWAATRAGIPAVTLEAGGPSELEIKEVMHGVKGIETLLHTLGMVKANRFWGDPEPVYYQSTWVRANSGGILLSDVSLGSTVKRGDLLGTITDPMSNDRTSLYSPFSGRIIGMARNQVVMPGFAAFHVGIQTAETSAREQPPTREPENAALEHATETSERDYLDAMSE